MASAIRAPAGNLQAHLNPKGGQAGKPDVNFTDMAKDAMGHVSDMATRVTAHVHDEEVPYRSNMYCFIGGIAVVANGAIGLVDVYNIEGATVYYILNGYQVFFGLLTMVMEIREEFAYGFHDAVHRFHIYLEEWFHGITRPIGKVVFYMFQSTLALVTSAMLTPGFFVGVYLLLMSLICFCEVRKENAREQEAFQQWQEEQAQGRGQRPGQPQTHQVRGVGGIPVAGNAPQGYTGPGMNANPQANQYLNFQVRQ